MLALSILFIRRTYYRTHYRTYNNIQPITVLEYPDQASKIIWSVTPNNISISSSQIKNLIKTNKISADLAFRLIDIASQIRVKDIKLFTDFYQQLSNEFSYTPSPKCLRLATLLYYRGYHFPNFSPSMKEEEVLNIYSIDSPLYYIAWDKVDDLKSKFPDLDINKKIDNLSPLDCAIQYGSERCFNYLYYKGAYYSSDSQKYAVQGGNNNIFIQMIQDGKRFDNLINIALDYHNFYIATYLKLHFGQVPDSIADCFYYGNFDVASTLLSKGVDVDDRHIFFHLKSIIV
ncbi:hypothetical protein TVAG_072570 [Trichomonas vaginalis G3]|uniref:DUF3447 domain-containing protein n=1 Tax=Trichomonas vaginalis (strain ATCC PRA-98 / G3) TaxID=412133 RepID=A2EUE0_TRIV3|nr:protein ubiquitination [Trichomonas vaginalis G3]EAY03764.1 hypothetical protein TVAG_072570 [Trichomonas vaginalis G3]KAI5532720.1 protein ubiquitination [Trichomonas vaginalis G3]|eukprot:XP_001315987.1 hypothetical protein [Trichomonas vaginalis G3]